MRIARDTRPTASIDLRAVAAWVSAHLGAIRHEHRVREIAETLFDLSHAIHRLDDRSRELLAAAALVHDVGRSIEKAEHPALGAQMLLRDRSLPVGEADRRALAFLTLYHRDRVPPPGDETVLNPSDDRPQLRKLLALLRAADALDSRSLETPQLVFGLKRKRIEIACYLARPTEKARRVYERRKKFRLIEEELGVTIDVNVRTAEALRMVA